MARRKRLLTCGRWAGMACLCGWPAALLGLELPREPFANLKADEFRVREAAQMELLAWSRARPSEAMAELFRQSRVADDPEARERCLQVLKALVLDQYLKEGEGFVGIQMLDDVADVPNDPKRRSAVRVLQVVADSAAQQAGLQLNDLIVGLDGEVWRDVPATESFAAKIRQSKPKQKIMLKVLRNGQLMDLEVTLARRPAAADLPLAEPEAAERAAQDAYFQRWLGRQKISAAQP